MVDCIKWASALRVQYTIVSINKYKLLFNESIN